MKQQRLYSIGELAQAAGVTPRTVRYYTAEGLLPPPDTRGKYAGYGEDHLRRLQLIGRLKAAYLPLQEIRARLEQLSSGEVVQLLEETPPPVQAHRERGSASDYLARVLEGGSGGSTQRHARPPSFRPPAERMIEQDQAAALEAEPGGKRVALQQPAPPRLMEDGPAWQPAEAPAAESWQRLPLAPGVELHLRMPLDPAQHAAIDRLVTVASELFRENT